MLLQEVCHQMNSVFKELSVRQQQQDQFSSSSVPPSSTLSYSSGSPQTFNKRGMTPQKGKGHFKPAEQMNWEIRAINWLAHIETEEKRRAQEACY